MRCPYDLCAGDGWLIDERTRSATECRCMPEQRAARVAGTLRARIPREYQDASFQHTNISGLPRNAVARVRRYVDTLDERLEAGDGLWISGSIGTGKTWLAMLVARYAIEQGRAVAVYSVPRLLSEIRRTYDGEGTKTLDLLDQLTEVSLLVLDDVGTERTNPWVLEQLYSIINERWQERRAIVLTTNLNPIDMQDQIGERAVSRLVGMCETVTINGVDHRQPDPGGHRAGLAGGGGPSSFAPGGPTGADTRATGGHGYDADRGLPPAGRPVDPPEFGGPGHLEPRSGGPLGPPPPLDPETAAWAAGAGAGPQSRREDAPPGPEDDFGAPPPPRTFGLNPSEEKPRARRQFGD